MTEPDPDTDVLDRLRSALDTARPVVAATSDADLDRPTPCAEWTVRDLVGHMTATLTLFADDPDTARSFEDAGGAAVAAWSAPGRLAGTATLPFGEVPAPFALEFPVLDVLVHTWDLAQAIGRDVVWDRDSVAASLRFAESTFAGPESRGPAFDPPVEPPPDADDVTRLVRFLGRPGPGST